MKLIRFFKHLLLPDWWVQRVFSRADLAAIGAAVTACEKSHLGELRFVVEGPLPVSALWHGLSPRARAIALFSTLRVWDTEENCGILIYVQLVDRRVEILADRGIAGRVEQAEWDRICRAMEASFAQGAWRRGVLEAIDRATRLLSLHFPARRDNPNELDDRPRIL